MSKGNEPDVESVPLIVDIITSDESEGPDGSVSINITERSSDKHSVRRAELGDRILGALRWEIEGGAEDGIEHSILPGW